MAGLTPNVDAGLAQQAMELRVSDARRRLNDGALVQETLEWLWRVAYAAGVRVGQAPPQRSASERVRRIVEADAAGWRYGTPWLYMRDMKAGFRFRYGGVDQEGPNCERTATMVPAGNRGARMQLEDTGETVRIPSVCWTRPEPEEDDGG